MGIFTKITSRIPKDMIAVSLRTEPKESLNKTRNMG